jgi:hypothetical protein
MASSAVWGSLSSKQGVDHRDKPGDDEVGLSSAPTFVSLAPPFEATGGPLE